MKKLLLILLLPILAASAFLVWQNLPEKRFARHIIKARLFAKENNLTAARLEYEKAYGITEGYSPFVSMEVLALTNRMNLQDKREQEALSNTRAFVQKHPENKNGRLMLAQLAFAAGELESTFESIDAVLEMDPWNFPARLMLTSVRANQGRLDLAEEQLRYLYGKYPDSMQAMLPLAEVLLKQGRVTESRRFLARILELHPKLSQARMLMADSYLRARNLDSAQLVLDAWMAADPANAQQLQIRKARLYSMSNRLAEAKAALAGFVEQHEANLPAFTEIALLHAKAGHYDSAIRVYQAMGELSPAARPGAENMIFYLYLKTLNPARALETLKSLRISDKRPALLPPLIASYIAIGQENKADDLAAEQPDSLKQSLLAFRAQLEPDKEFIGQWALITYFGLNGQDLGAFQAVEEIYRRWPKNPMSISLYTTHLAGTGRFAEAIRVLQTEAHPTLTQRVALMGLHSKAGQNEKAILLADRLAAENPRLRGINLMLADHWMKKDKVRGIAHYLKELALNPENEMVLNNLAWEYGIEQGDFAKAAPFVEKLKTRRRLDPHILDTIGWILAVNGNGKEAEKFVRNALNLVPDHPAFLYHLAYILEQAGKKEEARKFLDESLASPRPFSERKAAEQLLARMG